MGMAMRMLLLSVVFLWSLSPALAADPAKRPEGFRGIPWGESIEALPDMILVETDGDIRHYDRKDEKKKLGSIPVQMVDYSFYKGRFYHAAVTYEYGFNAVQDTLTKKYGPADAALEKKDKQGRPYVTAVWKWPGRVYIGHRRYTDEQGGRIFYFDIPLADASEGRASAAPASPSAKETPSDADYVEYTVAKGDVVSRIAKRFGVKTADILKANNITDARKVRDGDVLKIPKAR